MFYIYFFLTIFASLYSSNSITISMILGVASVLILTFGKVLVGLLLSVVIPFRYRQQLLFELELVMYISTYALYIYLYSNFSLYLFSAAVVNSTLDFFCKKRK